MTEQNPDTSTSESAPAAQPSSKGQENLRGRGTAGRGSRRRDKGRGSGCNQKPNNSNNDRLLKGESQEKEFTNVTLIANGDPK